jgi:serine/threonine-protein kinase
MVPERWKRIEMLFESALEREPAERAAFLKRECGGDDSLREVVESLLAHHQPTGQFITTLVRDAARLMFQETSLTGNEARFIPGRVLANRYRIIGLLGKGGMGEVYRADDLKLGQAVALKFLPEKLEKNRDMLERFHREVRIARQISHPNVCRVFDIGEVESQHFLSMEYIDGENLATLLRRIGRLPSDKAMEISSQLCAGLAAAHEEGVLHRDLKPANVMIDGRGRAKITDFGLAGLVDEIKGHEVRAGTPAYMAPEQLSGKEVTVRSDIYSLGLVLYEIFTGRKAFEATTLEELVKLQESSTPPSISSIVKEIDPLVERVILRCLDKDSRNRPATVTQVAAALPGGDPLAAALAAGETPSPEMVAAAPTEGALRPAVAVACFAGVLALLALIVIASESVMLHNRVGLDKPPEVLAERASAVIKRLGYREPPVDSDYGFQLVSDYYFYWSQRSGPDRYWDDLEKGQPSIISFWYRQSPRYLETLSGSFVTQSDPPEQVTNMASVVLDTKGRLIRFNAIPSQVEQPADQASAPDWSALFAEAGLDPAGFASTASTWIPPVAYDTRAAWEGFYPDRPDVAIRVEAAAFRGRPVYFHIIPPWERPERQEEFLSTASRRAAGVLLAVTFFAGLFSAVLLARRNLRLGRGDRRGAFKLAIFVFIVAMVGSLLQSDHVPTLGGELAVWYEAAAWALFFSALLWTLYVALEPYVRRLWPNLIISWSRLLAGGYRDPMVGRDIMIGALLGLGHTLSIYFMPLISRWLGYPSPPNPGADIRAFGMQNLIGKLLAETVTISFLFGFGCLLLLLLFYVVLRREWLAALAFWLIFVSIELLAFASVGQWVSWVGPIIIATLQTIGSARFGLLTMFSAQVFFDLSFHYPITSDLSSWYGGTAIFTLVVLVALAAYGFYTSLGGQTLFRPGVFSE